METALLDFAGLLGQVLATLLTAAVMGCVGWLARTIRARRGRRWKNPEKIGRSTSSSLARGEPTVLGRKVTGDAGRNE